jgi:serine/threonine-protein kinase HipA
MILSVFIGNGRIGRLADNPDGSGRIFFEYDPAWQQMGIELAPFFLPSSLSGPTGFDFPAYPAVKNLPGLMWDSLPDSWGMLLLEARIRNAGLHPSHSSGTVFLSHIGSAGMGALRYEPDYATPEEENFLTSLEKIDAEALQAQQDQPPSGMGALKELLKVG